MTLTVIVSTYLMKYMKVELVKSFRQGGHTMHYNQSLTAGELLADLGIPSDMAGMITFNKVRIDQSTSIDGDGEVRILPGIIGG